VMREPSWRWLHNFLPSRRRITAIERKREHKRRSVSTKVSRRYPYACHRFSAPECDLTFGDAQLCWSYTIDGGRTASKSSFEFSKPRKKSSSVMFVTGLVRAHVALGMVRLTKTPTKKS
jgi:hypothetical protein